MAAVDNQDNNMRDALLSSKHDGSGQVRGHGLGLWRHVTAWRWCGWAVSAVFFFFDVGIRLSTDVVNSDLRSTFDIDATGVSNIGAAFFYAYACMQLPAGWALDFSVRLSYIVGSLMACAGTLLVGFSTSYGVCVIGRVLTGAGCAVAWLGAVKVCRTNFGLCGKLSDTMLGVSNALGGLGGLVSQFPFQALASSSLHWRGAYKVTACIPLLTAVGAALFISDEPDKALHALADADERIHRRVDDSSFGSAVSDSSTSSHTPLDMPATSTRLQSTWIRVKHFVRIPRVWLFAGYLAGTDAPFEAFAGLWGVAYLRQAVNMTKSKAGVFVTVLTVISTLSQLGFGPVDAWLPRYRHRTTLLACLSFAGALGLLPFILGMDSLADGIIWLAMVLIGLSVGSATVVWTVISSDPLCDGLEASGLLSGAINTLCIFSDAIVQTLVGVILDANWDGHSYMPDDGDSGDAKVKRFTPGAFAKAFALCFTVMGLSCIFALILRAKGRRGIS